MSKRKPIAVMSAKMGGNTASVTIFDTGDKVANIRNNRKLVTEFCALFNAIASVAELDVPKIGIIE